jgi:hypothetical protein
MKFRNNKNIELLYKMPSAWNMFVKKVYEEGKAKDPSYEFKNALKDASKRKSEMGHSASASGVKKHHKTAKRGRGKSRSASMAMAGGRRSRRHRRHRR